MGRDRDPYDFAERVGVAILVWHNPPWDVASNGDAVIVCAHPDPRVVAARAWEGLAQALLERERVPWRLDDAVALAAQLKAGLGRYH